MQSHTEFVSQDEEMKELELKRESTVVAELPATASATTDTFADEDNPYFVHDLEYSREEEAKVIRTLDIRLFPWILLTTFVLNMDRTNISNAISDNLPADLGFTIDVVNTSTAVYSVLFSITCLTGAVIAKVAGPAACELRSVLNVSNEIELRSSRDLDTHVQLGARNSGTCSDIKSGWISCWYVSID